MRIVLGASFSSTLISKSYVVTGLEGGAGGAEARREGL